MEIMINERVYEGLMRGEIRNERQWWGTYPNRYKITDTGIVYKKTK